MVNTRTISYSPERAQRACVENTFAPSSIPSSSVGASAAEYLTSIAADLKPAHNTEHAPPLTHAADASTDHGKVTAANAPPASDTAAGAAVKVAVR